MKETLHIDSSSIASILGTVGSPLVVISELIKNAIDASADKIRIAYSRELQSITVVDDGLGFSLEDIRQLSQPGFSKKKSNGNLTNAKGSFYTGSKGLGLLSVFSLCNHLTIQTKSDTDGEYLINWSKDDGSYSYEQIVDSQMVRGTIITLNNIFPEVMTLLTSESEVKKLRHISTYLYKHASLPFPEITLSIDGSEPNSLLFTTELKDMLYDVIFNYDSSTETLSFQCFSERFQINSSKIFINSFDTADIELILNKYFNIKETIKTRTNDNISFKELESIEGVPTFEGRLLVYERKTAGKLKDFGAGVNIYANDFALYNYLSEENDWLGLADFSQRKKNTRLRPHNAFGFVNLPYFDESKEQLKISNERADFIQDAVFVKLMYLLKGVVMFMIFNIDIAKYQKPAKGRFVDGDIKSVPETSKGEHLQQEATIHMGETANNPSQNNTSGNKEYPKFSGEGALDEGKKDTDSVIKENDTYQGEPDSQKKEEELVNDEGEEEQEENYEPEVGFKPTHRKRYNLTFTAAEGLLIDKLKNTDDLGNKIYQTIYELSKLNVLY
ncbi:ATP-binding protein, partial [Brevibacillus borstelensis]